MRTGCIFALPMIAIAIHPELEGAYTPEEKFAIFSSTTSESLLSALPDELRGDNMTLGNFQKYFTYTLYYNGRPIIPRPEAALPPHRALRGDGNIIVNTGKFIWDIIKNDKPVTDLAGLGSYANGVPSDVDKNKISFDRSPTIEPSPHSDDGPQILDGHHWYKWLGGFGNTACEIQYRNSWLAHGTRSGHKDGYIEQATQLIDVGYAQGISHLHGDVSVSDPANVGNNVALLTFKLHLSCDNQQVYVNFLMRGDGTFESLDSFDFVEV